MKYFTPTLEQIQQFYDWLDEGKATTEDLFWMISRKWGSKEAERFVNTLIGIEEI